MLLGFYIPKSHNHHYGKLDCSAQWCFYLISKIIPSKPGSTDLGSSLFSVS